MKHQVKFSTGSVVMSVCVIGLLCVMLCYFAKTESSLALYILAVVVVALSVVALYYAPLSVSVNEKELCVNRSLRVKKIPLCEIESIRLCPPTMSERRLCGSGGFLGYWGWFSEKDLGRYFAYYGRSSDCFLVTLRNGKKYMLGCEHPAYVVDYVRRRIAGGGCE